MFWGTHVRLSFWLYVCLNGGISGWMAIHMPYVCLATILKCFFRSRRWLRSSQGVAMNSAIWRLIWHFIWHSIWHLIWHSIWQSNWHFIWHSNRHSFIFYLTYVLKLYLTFGFASCVTFCMAQCSLQSQRAGELERLANGLAPASPREPGSSKVRRASPSWRAQNRVAF
jgi:hypothetical protein